VPAKIHESVLERTRDEFGASSGAIIAEMPETAIIKGLTL